MTLRSEVVVIAVVFVVHYQEVRLAIAPLLRGFQAEFDAAAKRTKAADGAFLAVYKKLVHMPGQCFSFNLLTMDIVIISHT